MSTRSVTALFMMLATLASIGCSDREDNEARLLLDRVTLIHHDAPAAERRQRIDALEQIPLSDEELVALRDICVRGHGALLEAEESQARAARALGRLTGGRDDVSIPTRDAERIEADILASNAAIEQARSELTRCQAEVASLDRRYSGR